MDEITVEAENETSEGCDVGTEAVDGNSNVNPWPRLEELFTFSALSSGKNNLLFKCKLCPPSKKPFSTYKTSHSNLRKHVKVRDKMWKRQLFCPSSHFVFFRLWCSHHAGTNKCHLIFCFCIVYTIPVNFRCDFNECSHHAVCLMIYFH